MQEKVQKISPIKRRILQFADTLNISRREFYSKIGISRGTLESNTGITEDVVAKFIAAFPYVSIEWLILGKGQMIKDKMPDNILANSNAVELVLKRDEQLIRENERLLIKVDELEKKFGVNNSPPQRKDIQSADR